MNRSSGFRETGTFLNITVSGTATIGTLVVTGTSSFDNGAITTDGSGNVTFTSNLTPIKLAPGATIAVGAGGGLFIQIPTGQILTISGSGNLTAANITATNSFTTSLLALGTAVRLNFVPVTQNTSATLSVANSCYQCFGANSPTWTLPASVPSATMYLFNRGTGTVTIAGGPAGLTKLPPDTGVLVSYQTGWRVIGSWGIPFFTGITSGALPTKSPSSGAGLQITTVYDAAIRIPITFNPTAIATATCLVEMSPDNVTYSTIGTITVENVASLAGSIQIYTDLVRAGWWIRFTVTNAVLGTLTYS